MYIQKMKHKIPLLLFDAGRTKKNGKYINVITENHKTAKKLFEIIIREILSIIIANTRDKRKRAKFTRIFLYIISNKYKQKKQEWK